MCFSLSLSLSHTHTHTLSLSLSLSLSHSLSQLTWNVFEKRLMEVVVQQPHIPACTRHTHAHACTRHTHAHACTRHTRHTHAHAHDTHTHTHTHAHTTHTQTTQESIVKREGEEKKQLPSLEHCGANLSRYDCSFSLRSELASSEPDKSSAYFSI